MAGNAGGIVENNNTIGIVFHFRRDGFPVGLFIIKVKMIGIEGCLEATNEQQGLELLWRILG